MIKPAGSNHGKALFVHLLGTSGKKVAKPRHERRYRMKANAASILLGVVVVMMLLSAGCASEQCAIDKTDVKVKINPDDSSPPKVCIVVRQSDGQWQKAETAEFIGPDVPLNLGCYVSDPESGVSQVDLTFTLTSPQNPCGGGLYPCAVEGVQDQTCRPVSNMPNTMSQTLKPDASGQAISTVPIFATLVEPKCSHSAGKEGSPAAFTMTVTCKGQNSSSKPENKTASVNLIVK